MMQHQIHTSDNESALALQLLQQVCKEAWPGFGIVNPGNFGKDYCHLDCNLHNSS